tara:strand:+ start:4436 stop:4849 length:414 start_codon:yes stop_codon:yes gene_type:complete
MRDIDEIIIHCSATPAHKDFSAEDIRDWHVKGNGWNDIGYHYIIRLDGSMQYGRPLEVSGAHCKGHNLGSIGICYIGGMDKAMECAEDTRTPKQIASLLELLRLLKKFHPKAKIHGHRDFSKKECPSFDATEEYKDI